MRDKVLKILADHIGRKDINIDGMVHDLLEAKKAGGTEHWTSKVMRKGSRDAPDWRVDMKAGIPTGIAGLDTILEGGLRRGEVGMLAGVPEAGKTRTLVNLAANALHAKRKLVYVSLEQPWDQIRSFLTMARYDLFESEVSWKFKRQIKKLEDNNALVPFDFSSSDATIAQIHEGLYYLDSRPDLVVVDYLDLVLPGPKAEQRRFDYGDILQHFARIAKEFRCALWTATQADANAVKYGIKDLTGLAEAKIQKSAHISVGIGINTTKDPTKLKYTVFKKRRAKSGYIDTIATLGKYRIS